MSADAEGPDGSRSSDPNAAESFPTPPRTVADDEGRSIRLRTGDDPPAERESSTATAEREALAAMYDAFGTADRAQGIPPADPRRRRRWLDRVTDGVAVVAWHRDRGVGHGVLLDGDDGHELALFVRPGYCRAGIGSAVLRTLLGRGRSAGVERVWLSVQRGNRPAVRLYRKAGFRPDGATDLGAALTMARSLR